MFPNLESNVLLGRRAFLAGGLGLAALPRMALGAGRRADAPAQTVIQIFLQGGLSHIDTWDPKPYAPVEYRGEFGTVPSKVDGEVLSQTLRYTAAIADRIAIVRSMTHTQAAHERGTHSMLTGYPPSPAVTYPSLGAVVSHELHGRNALPPYVSIPNASLMFLGSGYLGAANGPFSPGSDPSRRNFRVRDLAAPGGVNRKREHARRKLLAEIDGEFGATGDATRAVDAFYEQAYAMIDSKAARAAFRIDAEKKATRDAYGRTPIGQRLLLARRLTEAGVRYVTVLDGGYDNHRRIFPALRRRMAAFDRGFSRLIGDLDHRGLLDHTLVLVTSEFGRTPRVNRDAGRDHWPRVFSVVLAGAGIRRGFVHGASNDVGAEVERDPVSPADLAATVFSQIGVDPSTKILSPGGRPIQVVRNGRVLRELLA